MVATIQDKSSELSDLCRRHRVKRLALFGSAAGSTSNFVPNDLDFIVEFEPMSPVEHADSYFDFLEALERLFGMPVDLVEPEAVRNPYFRRTIEQTRVLVYDSSGSA